MNRITASVAAFAIAGASLVATSAPSQAAEVCVEGEVSIAFRVTSTDSFCLRTVEANEVATLGGVIDDLGQKYATLYEETHLTIAKLHNRIIFKDKRIRILRQQLKAAGITPKA
jgi:hypothetical protein